MSMAYLIVHACSANVYVDANLEENIHKSKKRVVVVFIH